jgi:hypothetical protein
MEAVDPGMANARALEVMVRAKIVARILAVVFCGSGPLACQAEVVAQPTEECRTVEVRSRHDVEVCVSRCGDEGCRTHCSERERWSRQHHCWVE